MDHLISHLTIEQDILLISNEYLYNSLLLDQYGTLWAYRLEMTTTVGLARWVNLEQAGKFF